MSKFKFTHWNRLKFSQKFIATTLHNFRFYIDKFCESTEGSYIFARLDRFSKRKFIWLPSSETIKKVQFFSPSKKPVPNHHIIIILIILCPLTSLWDFYLFTTGMKSIYINRAADIDIELQKKLSPRIRKKRQSNNNCIDTGKEIAAFYEVT